MSIGVRTVVRIYLYRLPNLFGNFKGVFLPLGPCGQGGFAMVQLGKTALALSEMESSPLPNNLRLAGPCFYGIGIFSSLGLFGLGMWWWAIALVSFVSRARSRDSSAKLSFNMG